MNNRFKFRFWDRKNKTYFTCGNIDHESGILRCYPYRTFDWCIERPRFFLPEQCTGLKDKNGRLIYENDIFKIDDDIWCIFVDAYGLWTACYKGNPIRGCMEWDYFVKEYIIDRETPLLEVIGNINQNGDLLNG